MVPFPTRAPELNPIELNWNTFVKLLKKEELETLDYGGGPEVLQGLACKVLSNFIHCDNIKNYTKCGYIVI